MGKVKSAQADEIRALKRMREREIDTTDIPLTADWSKAAVGKFYRPIKKPLTIRLDADVLHWLKEQGKGYQTRINAILRNVMYRSRGAPAVLRHTGESLLEGRAKAPSRGLSKPPARTGGASRSSR